MIFRFFKNRHLNAKKCIKIEWLLLFFCILLFSSEAIASPWIIAHRGGKHNYPENTLLAFSKALECGVDAIELDIQLTQDGIIVVYHPPDLNRWTEGNGSIQSHTFSYINNLDAAYHYGENRGYPFRGKELRIPSLRQVLDALPTAFFILDLKSLPAEPLVKALTKTVTDEEAKQIVFYSTHSAHIELLKQYKPDWQVFEKRTDTLQRLFDIYLTGKMRFPIYSNWIGFELRRTMTVEENLTLGTQSIPVEFLLWNPKVIACLRESNPNAFLVLFGINTKQDFREALNLGVDAIYTDNPRKICSLKENSLANQPSHKLLQP